MYPGFKFCRRAVHTIGGGELTIPYTNTDLSKKQKLPMEPCIHDSIGGWSEWRDSLASAPKGADRGSPPSSWRRQRSSALHLDASSLAPPKEISRNGIKPFLLIWSEWRDSNSRHPGPKPGALPAGPHPEIYELGVLYTIGLQKAIIK